MFTQPSLSSPLLSSPIPIPFSILHAVHASDQAMYPVDLPYSRLQAWVDAAADLCLYYPPPSSQAQAPTLEKSIEHGTGSTDDGHQEREQGPASESPGGGVVVVLPLRRQHWEDLLAGRLKEPEIDPGCMFPPLSHRQDSEAGDGEGEEEEVGLHVYHIERFGDVWLGEAQVSKKPRFSEVALAEVVSRARGRRGWKILGMSALTATEAGKKTFRGLGFTPTGYREVFVDRGLSGSKVDGGEGRQVEMMRISPGEEVQVEDAVVVSTSEMVVVKYNV